MIAQAGFVRGPLQRNDRIGMIERAWGLVFSNHIKGAYYEFGLYKGQSFLNAWQAYLRHQRWAENQLMAPEQWRKDAISDFCKFQAMFYGFDTFEGIPKNQEGCANYGGEHFRCSEDEVRRSLEGHKIPFL